MDGTGPGYITDFSPRQRVIALLLLLAALAPFLCARSRQWVNAPFWDAKGYALGIDGYARDHTPVSSYEIPIFTPIDYPPIFILGGDLLARILTPNVGYLLYLFLHFACLIGLPFLLAGFFLNGMTGLEALLLLAISPHFMGEEVFFATNIASICYFLIFLSAIPGLRSNRWLWFYTVIALTSSIKIIFLGFLIVPFFLGIAQLIPSIVTVVVTASIYVAQMIWVPDLYREFRRMLSSNIVYSTGNYGYAVWGMVANSLKRFQSMDRILPGIAQILFASLVMLVLFKLRGKVQPRDPRWVALVILSFFLILPRLWDYDTITALLPAYYLLLPTWRSPVTIGLIVVSVLGLFIGHGAVGLLVLLISAAGVGAHALFQTSRARAEESADQAQLASTA
jgi:hypothetical protein